MRVRLQLHGVLLGLAAADELSCDVPVGCTVGMALAQLADTRPQLAEHLDSSACAIGEALVSRTQTLQEGDLLALIPPVSGG